ncbi:MAG: hypothetical protein ACRBFS_18230 [Aureispira sp.]
MIFVNEVFRRNKPLAYTGVLFLLHSILFALALPFHEVEILGINALIKPLKFSFSIWIFCWTMAYFVHYFEDKVLVKRLVVLIIITMFYEQTVISIQALRGTLSHFNEKTLLEMGLFAMMGIMITAMTLYLAFANIKFWKQDDGLPKIIKVSIFWGINIFVVSGLMGGVMGYLLSHNIGGAMGGNSLPVTNWSVQYGDLRVGHFIGLHALQVLPLVGFGLHQRLSSTSRAILLIKMVCLFYAIFVIFTFGQAFLGLPFLRL